MKRGWSGDITESPKDTIKLGNSLTNYLEIGDLILLNGELASGKTTFMKGVLNGFNYDGSVTSPTFTLVNEYNSIPKIIHIDCYRETNLNRWINLGINEYFDSKSIIFIEWAELIQPILPEKYFEIKFSHIESNKRKIEFQKS